MRNAHLSLSEQWPNVVVWNSHDRVFGRTCLTKAATDRMADQLHPGTTAYGEIADRLVEDAIGAPIPFSKGLAKGARTTAGYWVAHTAYARAIEDTAYIELVAIGEYVGQTSTTIDFGWPSNATLAINAYDVIEFGAGAMVYVLPSGVGRSTNGTNTRLTGLTVPANTFTTGVVRVWRRKYGDSTLEGLLQSSPGNRFIKRGIVNTGGSGFLDIESVGYDNVLAKDWDVQRASDSLYVQGVGAVTITGATIAPQGNALRILVSGDYTSYVGNQVAIYGSHVREIVGAAISVTFDAASVAATATADQTVTVHGATTDCGVIVTPPAAVEAGLTWSAWGSANNTVKIRFNNPTASAVDLSSGTWKFRIVK